MTVYPMQRRQTGEYTCGASALTVAIAEIAQDPTLNTDQQEEIIWRGVQGIDGTWSVPGKLGVYAWKGGPGIQAGIWQDDQKIAAVQKVVPPHLVAFPVDAHLREHNEALERAEHSGVRIVRGPHDTDTIVRLMDEAWRLLLVTIVPGTRGLGLHYLLGRKRVGVYGYALMDPAEGRDTGYSRQDLNAFLFAPVEELFGHARYLGIGVGLLDYLV